MKLALELVCELERADPEVKRIYGGLCHNFPVLVMQSGLCQALAFSADKASAQNNRAKAHKKLLEHVGKILGSDALNAAQESNVIQYMHHTRRILESWVYFKRFAKSVLGVEGGGKDEG
jgi:CRISPR-associated protein Cmr5